MHRDTIAAVLCAATVLLISNSCLSMAMVEDKISELPGQSPVSFAQYSGYVAVDAVRNRSIFLRRGRARSGHQAPCPLVKWS